MRQNDKKIYWDDSAMSSVAPDVFEFNFSRDEIALLVGKQMNEYSDRDTLTVQALSRIIMNPFTAKQMAHALNRLLNEFETKYGSAGLYDRSPEGSAPMSSSFKPSLRFGSPVSGEKADLVFQLVRSLGTDRDFERSFKISHRSLLANRFLLGTSKGAIGQQSNEKILYICERMGMPRNLMESFEKKMPDADHVHFGFEENEETSLYKVYLEFYETIEKKARIQPNQPGPFPLYLGFKWDSSDHEKTAITTYNWYPSLSIGAIQERVSSLFEHRRYGKLLEIAGGIVNLVSARIPDQDILFLEVTEENNPRTSIDINLYRANIRLEELYPFILEIYRHYSISSKAGHRLYENVKNEIFGHMSCGIDRKGRDFLTLYYGAKGVDQDRHPAKDDGRGYRSRSLNDVKRQPCSRKFPSVPQLSAPKSLSESLYTAPSGLSDRESPRVGGSGWRRRPLSKPHFTGVEATEEKAGLLFSLVNSLDTRVGFERSFSFFRKTLLTDRFLMGFQRNRIREGSYESILKICRGIDMPEDFLGTFQQHLPESNIVLFGFERNERNRIYKAYLEFGDRITEAIRKNPSSPGPLITHSAFKWDASDNSRKTAATYTCFPLLSMQEILERLTNICYGGEGRKVCLLVESALRIAATWTDPKRFLYFEVSEENSVRNSFDINLYPADLRLGELYPLLLQICWYYAIPYRQFNKVYESVKTQKFGHLTGGRDREGKDFLTIYFGEKVSSGAAYEKVSHDFHKS